MLGKGIQNKKIEIAGQEQKTKNGKNKIE